MVNPPLQGDFYEEVHDFLYAIGALTLVSTAQAAPPTVLYDNFTASLINSAKWFGGESDDARANLENIRYIVSNPTLGNRLRLYGRSYGASGIKPRYPFWRQCFKLPQSKFHQCNQGFGLG